MGEITTMPFAVERDPNYFSVTATSFVVSSPLSGLQIQIDIGEDFLTTSKVEVIGESKTVNGIEGLVSTGLKVENHAVRHLYGRVRMPLHAAEQLVGLLNEHVTRLKALAKSSAP